MRLTTRVNRLRKARELAAPWLEGWNVDDFIAARRKEGERGCKGLSPNVMFEHPKTS
jgi:hypothetical protein